MPFNSFGMRVTLDRIHPLGFRGWLYTQYGPVQVVIYDFFISNRGRINHHEFGGLPLYWVKPVEKLRDPRARKFSGFIFGHAHYGEEIYPRRELALGTVR